MKKRVFAFLLALAVLGCCVLPSFAAGRSSADSGKTVAKLYLCHRWSGPPSLGHMWVYIENLTGKPIQVGLYKVPAKQGVSVGNFGLTRADGNGTYYNVEAYCGNHFSLSGMISNSTDLTKSELDSISSEIRNHNRWAFFGSNCSDFAVRIWSLGGGELTISYVLPVFTKWQMKMHGDEGYVQMTNVSASQVKKQVGEGDSATLVTCSPGTIAKEIG